MLTNIPGANLFAAPFRPNFSNIPQQPVIPHSERLIPIQQSVTDTVKVFNFLADHGGCGCWRLIWPEMIMNLRGDLLSFNGILMTRDEGLYSQMTTIRIQRQASPGQLEFIKFLKGIQPKHKFKIVYEIDDIPFREDIPDYNKFKVAFSSDVIRQTCQEIMEQCDEITVPCDFMRDYFKSKINNQNITVIPNYVPRFWMGNFYDKDKLLSNLSIHKNKPRILYNGSAAHFDVDNRVKQQDDFYHVNDVIIKTCKKYKWVFIGAAPKALIPYIKSGDIEFHPWAKLMEYPYLIDRLNVQLMVAPLADNNFNKSKSDLKYLEGSCYGIPVICQDLVTYKNAPIKFKTGDEMIDRIEETLKEGVYKRASTAARKFAESRFLENEENIMKFVEMYKHPINSPERKFLLNR